MRSAFSWFAEFCHSQRLSHFAASFIVTRAETSIAKSCRAIEQSCKISLQLLAMDPSARVTMKDAAKCDKRCEWQNSANQENAERKLHSGVILQSMSVSGPLYCYAFNPSSDLGQSGWIALLSVCDEKSVVTWNIELMLEIAAWYCSGLLACDWWLSQFCWS